MIIETSSSRYKNLVSSILNKEIINGPNRYLYNNSNLVNKVDFWGMKSCDFGVLDKLKTLWEGQAIPLLRIIQMNQKKAPQCMALKKRQKRKAAGLKP